MELWGSFGDSRVGLKEDSFDSSARVCLFERFTASCMYARCFAARDGLKKIKVDQICRTDTEIVGQPCFFLDADGGGLDG